MSSRKKGGRGASTATSAQTSAPNPSRELEPAPTSEELKAAILENPQVLEDPKIAMVFSMKHHRGPLPAPEDFQEYENIQKGAAKEILGMAVRSLDSRIRQNDRELDLAEKNQASDFAEARRGQLFGLLVALVTLVGGMLLIDRGHDFAGCSICGGGLVAIVIGFIKGKPRERSTRE